MNNRALVTHTFEAVAPASILAILKTTSGFHYDGYVVLRADELLYTGRYGTLTTAKANGPFHASHLTRLVLQLEDRGICSDITDSASDNGAHGDFLAYQSPTGIRYCFEEGGYWDDNNVLHHWFWSKFGSDLKYSYDYNREIP